MLKKMKKIKRQFILAIFLSLGFTFPSETAAATATTAAEEAAAKLTAAQAVIDNEEWKTITRGYLSMECIMAQRSVCCKCADSALECSRLGDMMNSC